MAVPKMKELRRCLRFLERIFSQKLKYDTGCCGVTVAQCHTMLEIHDAETAPLCSIAQELGLDSSTLSRTVDGLVKRGYVNRCENPNDRRCIMVSLTEQGKKIVKQINSLYDRTIDVLLHKIPEKKQEMVIESVILLIQSVGELKNTCCDSK
jgi:DNA-binding MarR family transcriptional regulator